MPDLRWRALAEIRQLPGCHNVQDIAINRVTDECAADEGVSMFAADFAILVAVAIVETCLAHAALHCAAADSICPPGARGYQTRFKRGLVRLASQGLSPDFQPT